MRRLLPIVFLLLAGCSSDTAGGPDAACTTTADCDPGHACLSSRCEKLCRVDGDCGPNNCSAGLICSGGTCAPGCRSGAPVITAVNGNGSPDAGPMRAEGTRTANHLADGLHITGSDLEGSMVNLIDTSSGVIALVIDSASSTQLDVTIPSGVVQGTYTLQVVNAVGEDQMTVFLLQGETGPAGVDGATGPTGPVGPPGASPSATDIQTAVSAMTNVDFQSLGRWGQMFEAESAPVTSTIGTVEVDATASGGNSVLGRFGDPSGTLIELTSGSLGGLIALGPAIVEVRAKVLSNAGTPAGADNIGVLECEATRAMAPLVVGTRYIREPMFQAPDTWQIMQTACAFEPDDQAQAVRVTYTQMLSELEIDWIRVRPGQADPFYNIEMMQAHSQCAALAAVNVPNDTWWHAVRKPDAMTDCSTVCTNSGRDSDNWGTTCFGTVDTYWGQRWGTRSGYLSTPEQKMNTSCAFAGSFIAGLRNPWCCCSAP